MITIKYRAGYIELIPDTMDDNQELINIFKNSHINYSGNGSWNIEDKYADWISQCLVPVKGLLVIDDSIKMWRKGAETKSIIIFCDVINSYIKKGSFDLPTKELEEATRYFWKPAVNHPKFKSGKWDGYINLYKRWESSFPTGLLYKVEAVLAKKNLPYRIEYTYDRNPVKQFEWEICDGLTPDPDQILAVEACVSKKRGICKCPTGMGKTDIIAKRLAVHYGLPTLFIANKKSLLDDAKNSFISGIKGLTECSVIKDGWFGNTKLPSANIKPLTSPVIVATIQSLHARLKDETTKPFLMDWLRNVCKLVIVDECQSLGTTTWDEVMNECYAPYRIGLSATPRRTDNSTIKLMATTGDIIFTTTAEEQIKKGRLCELEIFYNVYNQKLYNDHDSDINYNEMYRACIIENCERNLNYIVNPTLEMIEEGRYVLVLIQYIEHGHILKEMFIENGLNENEIRFIWGDTPDKIRQNAISEFRKGEFKVMIGSTIFDAGVNIPVISGVVLAGAGNSDITLIQRIGRGARKCDYEDVLGYMPEFMSKSHGKKITKVYDIIDTNAKFFHKQSLNRYYNSREEFGKERVRLLGDKSALKKSKKCSSSIAKDIDYEAAQLDMLMEFTKK